MEIITTSAQETEKIGYKLGIYCLNNSHSNQANIILLFGELGSGKTTLVQGFGKGIGINKRINSPTFTIMHTYDLSDPAKKFYHLDLYRVSSSEIWHELSLEQILSNPQAIVIIEWPECIMQNLSLFKTLPITITPKDEKVRNISLPDEVKL